jgi:vacuolar-type H+-ATPase subunit F/Vma7
MNARKKFNIKEHPLGIACTAIAGTLVVCVAVGIPLHNLVVEQKDGTIQQKDATIESVKQENESLRRLQGDVVIVSTDDLQAVRQEVNSIEESLSSELRSFADAIAKLDLIGERLEKSIETDAPQKYGQLKALANIRPNGRTVNWMGDRKTGSGIVSSSASALSAKLIDMFKEFNAQKTQKCSDLLKDIEKAEPLWPYTYFYLGLNSINAGKPAKTHFEKAIASFRDYRNVGIVEPEHILYQAMSQTFVEEYEDAAVLMSELANFRGGPDDITILAINASSPESLRATFQELAEKKGLPLVVLKVQ